MWPIWKELFRPRDAYGAEQTLLLFTYLLGLTPFCCGVRRAHGISSWVDLATWMPCFSSVSLAIAFWPPSLSRRVLWDIFQLSNLTSRRLVAEIHWIDGHVYTLHLQRSSSASLDCTLRSDCSHWWSIARSGRLLWLSAYNATSAHTTLSHLRHPVGLFH